MLSTAKYIPFMCFILFYEAYWYVIGVVWVVTSVLAFPRIAHFREEQMEARTSWIPTNATMLCVELKRTRCGVCMSALHRKSSHVLFCLHLVAHRLLVRAAISARRVE